VLPSDVLKNAQQNKNMAKPNTAFTKPLVQEDVGLKRRGRHARTGSDGVKPTTMALKAKQVDFGSSGLYVS